MNRNEYVDKQILDAEELEIESAIEAGEYRSLANLEESKQRYRRLASETINKTKSITIRLNENDLRKIKAKAIALGVPYQTLIGSALHQYAKKDKLEV